MSIELGVLLAVVTIAMSGATFFAGRHSAAKSDGAREARLDTHVEALEKKAEEHGQRFGKIFDRLEQMGREATGFKAEFGEIRRLLDEVRGDVKRLLEQRGCA